MGVWYKYDNFDNSMEKKGAKALNDSAPGSGARFASLSQKLAAQPGVKNPKALAASIGRKKYGASKMGAWAAKGRATAAADPDGNND